MSGGLRLVRVIWEDATVVDPGATWVDRGTAPPPKARIFQQVGWLLSVDADAVVLTCAVDDDQMAPRDRIPAGMVLQILSFPLEAGEPVKIPKRRKS